MFTFLPSSQRKPQQEIAFRAPSMEWVRGDPVGYGSFATVNLAIPRNSSDHAYPLMVVKSSKSSCSASLKNEKQVLDQLSNCPQVIRCLGDDHSLENGEELYNLFLEYASNGSLADQLKNHGGSLSESDIPRYVKSVLKGLRDVHARGFVHCDIKLQNILVFGNRDIKIADFGLAKKAEQEQSGEGNRPEFRGTPLYMSPESVTDNEYESPADIWALGCAVVEMLTGKPAWNCGTEYNICKLLIRIGVGDEVPQVPEEFSFEGKDFLGKCFIKDPRKRWTAELLLDHPFVAAGDINDHDSIPLEDRKELKTSSSPRSPFEFPEWVSSVQSSVVVSTESSPESDNVFESQVMNSWVDSSALTRFSSPMDRLRQLVTDESPNWFCSESWLTVR